MMKLVTSALTRSALAFLFIIGFSTVATAVTPETRADGVTVIHLDEYNGYFAAKETVASLKAGVYEFVITNKAEKLVGFQIQGLNDRKNLDMFPLEPGETRTSRVTVGTDGVRFRCPINPTSWVELDNIK